MKLVFDITPQVNKAPVWSRRGTYKHPAVKAFQNSLAILARRQWKTKPLEGPLKSVWHYYIPIKDKKLWGTYCWKRPDGSNLRKSSEDALTNIVYLDDGQLVDNQDVKFYAEKGRIELYIYKI
jgi:Holliday junction resolvase RusA-like endonuclease